MKIAAARKCRSWACLQMTKLQCLIGCHGHRAILCNPNRLFSETIRFFWYLVVPLNNFSSMSICPLVQGKSNKPPSSTEVCLWGGIVIL